MLWLPDLKYLRWEAFYVDVWSGNNRVVAHTIDRRLISCVDYLAGNRKAESVPHAEICEYTAARYPHPLYQSPN
jgi:hypothetical protein